jgi:4-amino-4-deoxy-L-arabinose transferase-like glycosyltransferase
LARVGISRQMRLDGVGGRGTFWLVMRVWAVIRRIAGAGLVGVGLLAAVAFPVYQRGLGGLSADGVIQAHSWLGLRIILLGCILPGLSLLALEALLGGLRRLQEGIEGLSERRFLVLLLVGAGVLRLAAILVLPLHQFADYKLYDELAQLWVAHGYYTDGSGPTSFWPPGYPFFLSRIYMIFGHQPQAAVICNLILSVGIVYLGYRLCRVAFDEITARWAAVILAVFPSQILFVNITGSEVLFALLFVLGLCVWYVGVCDTPLRRGTWWWVSAPVAGVALGCATHVRTVALMMPVLFVVAAIGRRLIDARWWARWSLLVIVMAALLVPWVIRNHEQLGRATLATNAGFNFYVGNNPNSAMGYNQPDTTILYQGSWANEAHDDSAGYALGWEYIRAKPLAFVQRAVLKTAYLLLSDTEGLAYQIIDAAARGRMDRFIWLAVIAQGFHLTFMLAFLAGAILTLRSWREMTVAARLFAITIAYWLIVHAVFFGDGRYRFPIVPLLAGFAGMWIVQMVKRRSERAC